ncbi:diguanylate cyclase domain-containing protein [Desulfovibrio psychrotolerans]|nr:diguanylate cyclase [Desulfovibrio psychrotolerans]
MKPLPEVALEDGFQKVTSALRQSGTFSIPVRTGEGHLAGLSVRSLLDALDDRLSAVPAEVCSHVVRVRSSDLVDSFFSPEAFKADQVYVIEGEEGTLGFITAVELMSWVLRGITGLARDVADAARHVVLGASQTVYQAHKSLFESQRQTILVVDDAMRPVGMFNDKDISVLIEKGCDVWNTLLGEVAGPVVQIGGGVPLEQVCVRFMTSALECMVVTGEDGRAEGLLWRDAVMPELFGRVGAGVSDFPPCGSAEEGQKALQADFLERLLSCSFKSGIVGTDEYLNIIYFNSAARSLLGCTEKLSLGSQVWVITEACNISRDELTNALNGVRDGGEQTINSWRMEGGVKHFLQCRVNRVPSAKHLAGYVISIQDVTSQRNAEAAILKLAYYDRLTQLPNRLLFEERLQQEVRRCRRSRSKFAIMMVDLDGFKKVNDGLGHLLGDELLRQVGARLGENVRDSDTVARFGGDEFVFLLPEVEDYAAALRIATKVQQVVSAPYDLSGTEVTVFGSVGIAVYPDDSADTEALLQLADERMFINKRTGELVMVPLPG